MAFRISGQNLDVGEALRERINDRVAEAMAKYFDGGYSGHLTLARDGFGFRAECAIHLDSKITLHAEGMAPDAYASADQAAMRIEKRLRRYHRRLKDHRAERVDDRARSMPQASMPQAMSSPRRSTRARRDRRLHAGHHRRIHHRAEAALGQRRGDGTRHDRRPGPGVPARRPWRHQYRLPPRRRAFRLDRSAGRDGRRIPLTPGWPLPMVRRPYDA